MIAENFSLYDQFGRIHQLSDYLGRWVVLLFYSPGNQINFPKKADRIRNNTGKYMEKNIVVLGISEESIFSLFSLTKKFGVDFPILADEEYKVIKAYDYLSKTAGSRKELERISRKTYLIGPDGEIKKIYSDGLDPLFHANKIFKDIGKLSS